MKCKEGEYIILFIDYEALCDPRILLNIDSSDWLVVANSNQDCTLATSAPILFGEDIDTSCDLKCVTIATVIISAIMLLLVLLTQWLIVINWLP